MSGGTTTTWPRLSTGAIPAIVARLASAHLAVPDFIGTFAILGLGDLLRHTTATAAIIPGLAPASAAAAERNLVLTFALHRLLQHALPTLPIVSLLATACSFLAAERNLVLPLARRLSDLRGDTRAAFARIAASAYAPAALANLVRTGARLRAAQPSSFSPRGTASSSALDTAAATTFFAGCFAWYFGWIIFWYCCGCRGACCMTRGGGRNPLFFKHLPADTSSSVQDAAGSVACSVVWPAAWSVVWAPLGAAIARIKNAAMTAAEREMRLRCVDPGYDIGALRTQTNGQRKRRWMIVVANSRRKQISHMEGEAHCHQRDRTRISRSLVPRRLAQLHIERAGAAVADCGLGVAEHHGAQVWLRQP